MPQSAKVAHWPFTLPSYSQDSADPTGGQQTPPAFGMLAGHPDDGGGLVSAASAPAEDSLEVSASVSGERAPEDEQAAQTAPIEHRCHGFGTSNQWLIVEL